MNNGANLLGHVLAGRHHDEVVVDSLRGNDGSG
jgi:hypothetical protein